MSLKSATATTLKWNTIDRLSSQLVFAAVGIVLANKLSREDFGLVGVLAIFQAFAMVLVDSGFGAALLRLKKVERQDYSTVFWFNLLVSSTLYVILWFATPAIAGIFGGDPRLIPLSKLMFLSLVINGLGIVQTNKLMKEMNVRPVAISNFVGLVCGGAIGVWLALRGAGALALVWQTVAQATIRTSALWFCGKWWPEFVFSATSFSRIWRVGMGVMSSSFLNTLFLNIYPFVIGVWGSLPKLGVYTQADKWSKMGSASLSQTMTATFVPLLSKVQDSPVDFKRYVGRIDRLAALITFPVLAGIAAVGEPLFHFLFGNKWDDAIPLFQILSIRGIAVVMASVINNYLLALGYARSLVVAEFIKDGLALLAILATVWAHSLELLVWGQFAASAVNLVFMLWLISKKTGYGIKFFLTGPALFGGLTLLMAVAVMTFIHFTTSWPAAVVLTGGILLGAAIYVGGMAVGKVNELPELIDYIKGKIK